MTIKDCEPLFVWGFWLFGAIKDSLNKWCLVLRKLNL